MPLNDVEKVVENGRSKKKRWSFGGLFRKKGKRDSETSSDEEEGKKRGFLRRRKADRGSKDVTGLFVMQGVGRGSSTGSLEHQGRKRVKAKVEASREMLESSSGEEGSYSSSLASTGGSLNRRSRAARTERYLRRKCEPSSPSPTRKQPASVQQRSSSEQVVSKKMRAPLYMPPPPPLKPPAVSQRSVSEQCLSPPSYHQKPKHSVTNSGLSDSSRSESTPNHYEIKKPPTPPERRSSRQSVIIPEESRKRKSGNLEEALNELEAIYNSLRLADDDIDYRNLPYKTSSKSINSSNMSIKSNAVRRPDKISDDMAFRRWNKRNSNVTDTRDVLSQAGSYLLLSPTLSPPPVIPRVPNEPHITLDDVVYRNINHTNNTLRIDDPQPPFGIPLGPVPPPAQTDYLHASPAYSNQSIYNPNKTPDIVLDDLAFRNLRKDAQDTTVSIKKKKATRSLSANLSNIILGHNYSKSPSSSHYEVNNNFDDLKSQSYSDIPKDLRLAQRMLDIRLMNLRNKIKDQERAKMNSSSETLLNSNRSASVTPERRTPTREPQRSRYVLDGHFKYSDLHSLPERRHILRDDWRRPPTPEKKSLSKSKEELRKKFFADAYRNIDKTRSPTRLLESPKSKNNYSYPNSKIEHSSHTNSYRNERRSDMNNSLTNGHYHSNKKSPQKVLIGEHFFPKNMDISTANRIATSLEELLPQYSSNGKKRLSPQKRPKPITTPPPSPSCELNGINPIFACHSAIKPANFKVETDEEFTERMMSSCPSVHVKDKDESDVSGRATPHGEEVRRIMCSETMDVRSEEDIKMEEDELLKKLEEEAKATSLEMDRELQSLSVAVASTQGNEVSGRKVADLLRELTRSLDKDFGAEGACARQEDVPPRGSKPDQTGSFIALAYCMAAVQQLSSIDALSLFALFLAVVSVFLFILL